MTHFVADKEMLGKGYRDVVTGYAGVVIGVSHYWTGCDQVLLVPTILKPDGGRHPGEWFDCTRVVREKAADPRKDALEALSSIRQPQKGGPMTETPPPSA